MALCPQCNAQLRFDPNQQMLVCDHCDGVFSPNELTESAKVATEGNADTDLEVTVFRCPQCGGEVYSTDTQGAGFCSFCGTSTTMQSRLAKTKRPEFIIPFKLTKEDCKQILAQLVAKAMFLPDALRHHTKAESFRGIYMPYYLYHANINGHIVLKRSTEKRQGNYIITTYYAKEGDVDANYKWFYFDSSSSYDDSISMSLAPYDLKALRPFNTNYLSGFYADTADLPFSLLYPLAQGLAVASCVKELKGEENLRHYSVDATSLNGTTTEIKEKSYALFPVWFMAYRSLDRIAYAAINAQTGQIAIDLPMSFPKILRAALIVALALFVGEELLDYTWDLNKLLVCIGCALAVVASSFLRNAQEIAATATCENDLGKLYKERLRTMRDQACSTVAQGEQDPTDPDSLQGDKILEEAQNRQFARMRRLSDSSSCSQTGCVALILGGLLIPLALLEPTDFPKAPLYYFMVLALHIIYCVFSLTATVSKSPSQQGNCLGFPLAAFTVLFTVVILGTNPVSDLWYYGSAIAMLSSVILMMFDIIRQYNILSTRRLPQFDMQGGDDDA